MSDACEAGARPRPAARRPAAHRIAAAEPPWSCDGLSFVEVYEQHGSAVFAVARRTAPHHAEEVVQEVFVAIWRNPTRFDPARGSLRGFLVMMARNRAIDRVRSESSRSHREERSHRWGAAPTADHATGLLAAEVADDVTRALGRLSADCREAIVAAFYGGMTYTEVALALGAPEGTVKSRIRRGLSQLRSELGPMGAGRDAVEAQSA